mgnify:FL=1
MKLKKITLLSVVATLCLNLTSQAQEPIKALRVGDKLPETFWQQEHTIYANGQTSKHTLEKYKGKLLILDFWATWCSSCIKKMPYLDSLQRAYPDHLKILLVNSRKSDRDNTTVKLAFDEYAKGLVLSSVINDTHLGQLFPHRLLPHYVWIGANGQIISFSNSDFVNRATISKLTKNNGKELIQ